MSNTLSKKENALQAIKFALFSASAGLIQVVSFTLLNELLPDEFWESFSLESVANGALNP